MGKEQPFFSIIIPTYERPDNLADCLQSISYLEYPRDRMEVIVIDDGGKVSPQSVVACFSGQLEIKIIRQDNAGPAAARNMGASQANGEFLAFTDDDCTVASDWLKKLSVRFADMPDCAIGGRTLNVLPKNLFSNISHVILDYFYEYYNSDTNNARFIGSANMAVPSYKFRKMVGFDTSYPRAGGEDREFCERWINSGYRIIYAPEAVVFHAHGLTLRTFCRQHFNYGLSSYRFFKNRALRNKKTFSLEPKMFYLKLIYYSLYRGRSDRIAVSFLLLIISQILSIIGFMVAFVKKMNDV